MPKVKSKMRGVTPSTSRWKDQPENWTTAKLVRQIKGHGFVVPATLKRSILIQIYRDNVINKQTTTTESVRHVTNNWIKITKRRYRTLRTLMTHRDHHLHPQLGVHTAGQSEAEVENINTDNLGSENLIALTQSIRELKESVGFVQQEIRPLKGQASSAAGAASQNCRFLGFDQVSSRGNTRVALDSVAHVDVVSPQIRSKIIQGKGVNLAKPEPCHYESTDSQNKIVVLKSNSHDARLVKSLSLGDFITAFTRY